MPRHVIAVFGCAVLPDGRPSPSLARRIGYGLRAAADQPGSPILCSGAAGRRGPSEAAVMTRALAAAGVDPRRLSPDEASRDTLQSAAVVARLVRAEGLTGCTVCSDGYHIPRIRLLLWGLGVRSRPGPLAPGRGGLPLMAWVGMSLREAVAIPYDLALVWVRRRELLGE